MKALSQKRSCQKAAEEEFKKRAQEYTNQITQANIAMILCCLEKWGCKPETIRKRFNDIKLGYETTELFGRKIYEEDYIKQCRERYGIDVREVKVHVTVDFI